MTSTDRKLPKRIEEYQGKISALIPASKSWTKVIIINLVAIGIFSSLVYIKNNLHGLLTSKLGETSVELRSDGFYSEAVTIEVDQTVKFITTRSQPFWPASNLHPTHTLYPEFDPQRPIAPNKSWAFTFNKAGEWRYHDHLYSDFIGKIIVLPPGQVKTSTSLNCGKENWKYLEKNQKYQCWEVVISDLLQKRKLTTAFELMASTYRTDPDFAKDCHWFGHLIGKYAYKQISNKANITIAPEANYCAFGFYHGFMETLLQSGGDIKLAKDLCEQANAEIGANSKRLPAVLLACYHGIGHGLTEGHEEKAGGDERALIAPGLKVCDEISDNYDEVYRCAGGVFNVVSIAYNSGESRIKINPQNPLWLCHEQEERFKEACYGDMNVALAALTKNDLAKAGKFIEQIREDRLAKTGIISLAAAIAVKHLHDSDGYLSLALDCRSLQERLRIWCIRGIASGLAEYGPIEDELTPALKFCLASSLTEEERDYCTTQTLSYGRSIYPLEKALVFCNRVPEKYRRVCNWK